MKAMSRRDRERFADAALAMVDTAIVQRGHVGSPWREYLHDGDALLRVVAYSCGVDGEQMDVWSSVMKPTYEEWKTAGLPTHYPNLDPGETVKDNSYDGAISFALEVAQRIREGWQP